MSWIKSILAIIGCYYLLVATAQAEERRVTTPLYQCPAYLQLDSKSYAFKGSAFSDGPIENKAWLVPFPHPDESPSFGVQEAFPPRTLYVECHYKDTEHYLVLEAKGARWCAFTQWTPTWCE